MSHKARELKRWRRFRKRTLKSGKSEWFLVSHKNKQIFYWRKNPTYTITATAI